MVQVPVQIISYSFAGIIALSLATFLKRSLFSAKQRNLFFVSNCVQIVFVMFMLRFPADLSCWSFVTFSAIKNKRTQICLIGWWKFFDLVLFSASNLQ